MKPTAAALVLAGGSGSRMNHATPKQYLPVGDLPVIVQTIQKFFLWKPDLPMMVVIAETHKSHWEMVSNTYFADKLGTQLFVTFGGNTRAASVKKGLQALQEAANLSSESWILIHDSVRPFITLNLLEMALQTAVLHGNAVCAVPVKFSVREKTATGSKAVNREQYLEVQTPQIFTLKDLLTAYEFPSFQSFTDDASLIEASGKQVFLTQGSYQNLKITTQEDLLLAQQIWKNLDI